MRAKYGNVATTVNGIEFPSKREAARYQELLLLLYAGEIRNLELHPRFDIVVNGIHVCTYIADSRYQKTIDNKDVVEDTKGYRTAVYRMKKKLVKAVHNIDIVEV